MEEEYWELEVRGKQREKEAKRTDGHKVVKKGSKLRNFPQELREKESAFII